MMELNSFEDVLQLIIGPWGLWQSIIYGQIAFLQFFFGSINMAVIFLQIQPEFACDVYNGSEWNIQQILKMSSPLKHNGEFDPCFYYPRNYEALANISNFSQALLLADEEIGEPEKCHNWVFNRSVDMSETIVTQYNLVCDKHWYFEHSQTVYMVGFLLGSLASGFIADKFGRKTTFVLFGILTALLGIGESFAPNYSSFLAIRFFLSFTRIASTMGEYCLGLELTSSTYRNWLGGLYFLPYCFGYVFLAPVAYWTRDWRIMHIVISAPTLVSLVYWWTLTESPRWLLAEGKVSQAEKTIKTAAKLNRREIPENTDFNKISRNIRKADDSGVNQVYFHHIFQLSQDVHCTFKYPRLIGRTFCLYWIWVVISMVYYGISLNISSFSGDRFMNNAIAGFVEIPGTLVSVALLYWGRKPGLCITLLVAGVSLFVIPWLPENDKTQSFDWDTLRLACAMIGKLAITTAFNLVYLFTTELVVISMVYYGISLNISSFSGDRFMNNAIAGFVEIPGTLVSVALLYWGRKPGLCITLLVAGVSLFVIPWLPENDKTQSFDWDTLRLACAMIGKLAITTAFNLVYLFTTELYPTVIRNSLLATSSCVARIGSIMAPYISGISKVNKELSYIPMLIFGVCSLSAGFVSLLLPETKHMKLPESLDGAIKFEREKRNPKIIVSQYQNKTTRV